MKVQAIIPTAGVGTRFKANIPKPLVQIKGKPMFIWTLLAFEKSFSINGIILVAHEDYLGDYQDFVSQFGFKKVGHIIPGGKTRFDSVSNGLKTLDADTDMVVIHDGARPLITTTIIDEAIELCQEKQAVIVSVPVKPTIKRVNESLEVSETFDRSQLWEIQTPQVFNRDLIIRAYEGHVGEVPTDDSTLVEMQGEKVKVLMGDYTNLKVTTPEDFMAAEVFLEQREK